MRLVYVLAGVVLSLAALAQVLPHVDPGTVARVDRLLGRTGHDPQSVHWVQSWVRHPPPPFTAQAKPSAHCTAGTNGWDFMCTYRDPRNSTGPLLHFGAYVLRLPTGQLVVQPSGVTPVGRPIPPRPL